MRLKKVLLIDVLYANETTKMNSILNTESDNADYSNREIALFSIDNIAPASMEDDTAIVGSGESAFTTTYTYKELLDKITTGGYI